MLWDLREGHAQTFVHGLGDVGLSCSLLLLAFQGIEVAGK